MIRPKVIASLKELAMLLGPIADETEWHLFGSVGRGEVDALDIDLMILCKSDAQADLLRQAIDLDSFVLPLHLSLLTFEEAAAIDAPNMQQSIMIYPLASELDHMSSFTH
jgi:hypothetical protein